MILIWYIDRYMKVDCWPKYDKKWAGMKNYDNLKKWKILLDYNTSWFTRKLHHLRSYSFIFFRENNEVMMIA